MIERSITKHFRRLIEQYPVVTMTGPRQAGKTTLCKEIFPDYHYVNLEDLTVRNYATSDPKGFLAQFTKNVILDEIQRVPELTSCIQVIVDQKRKNGQFILTGSQQFDVTETINQSLAGRTAILRLLPFSFSELYSQKQSVSLQELLYTGFYPRIYDQKLVPTEALSFYLTTYVERDLRTLIHIKDLATFERFLRICATQIGQLVNYSRLANDCGITQNTVKSWLSLLKASYILYEIQPHYKNFRKRLTKSTKLYFYDVGLVSYLLGIKKPEHVNSHPLRGALFENFVVTEFIKNCYNNVQEENLYFFRDHVGHEIDLILDYGTQLLSVEIKSAKTINNEFFDGLNFYQELSGQQNTKRYLVYAGDKNYDWHGIKVFSYQSLEQLFSTLPN